MRRSEAVANKPLLYARGWGKKQAFCLYVSFAPLNGTVDTRPARPVQTGWKM
jgi:hypothetical protein